MAYQNAHVKTVIQVLHDGSRGFTDLGERLHAPELRAFFVEEARNRATFAEELEAEYGTDSGESNDLGGTTAGTVHRIWGDLKSDLRGGDHTLLATAEQGEDAAKKAYSTALDDKMIAGNLRDILERQQAHILRSHDRVKSLRDGAAS